MIDLYSLNTPSAHVQASRTLLYAQFLQLGTSIIQLNITLQKTEGVNIKPAFSLDVVRIILYAIQQRSYRLPRYSTQFWSYILSWETFSFNISLELFHGKIFPI